MTEIRAAYNCLWLYSQSALASPSSSVAGPRPLGLVQVAKVRNSPSQGGRRRQSGPQEGCWCQDRSQHDDVRWALSVWGNNDIEIACTPGPGIIIMHYAFKLSSPLQELSAARFLMLFWCIFSDFCFAHFFCFSSFFLRDGPRWTAAKTEKKKSPEKIWWMQKWQYFTPSLETSFCFRSFHRNFT